MRSPAYKHSRPFFLISSLVLKFCLPEEVVVVDRVGSTQIGQNQMVLVRCVMAEDNCNSAEKRILKEFHEFESNPSDDFKCALLDWNIYEWQFALRGPSGTEFEGGIYHGRIKFPEEYPSKPPSFMFLTENGCFKTQRDICSSRFLKWQSSWTVRYALLALIDLMPTYPDDELCSLECIKEGRRVLALKSRGAATTYGSSECQKVIDQIHQYMLSKAPNGTSGSSEPSQASNGTGGVSVAYNISQITVHSTDSHNVGIFGFMNEACIRGGGTLGPVLARTPIVQEYREIESNPSDDFKCGIFEHEMKAEGTQRHRRRHSRVERYWGLPLMVPIPRGLEFWVL